MLNLSKEVKISSAITPTAGAAGTADINGSTLDMSTFDAVLVIVRMGAIVAGAVTSIKMQQGDASDLSDAADLAGTAQTIADDDDDKTFFIDLVRPRKRFVRVVVARGTQNATVASAEYAQYGWKEAPTSHGANVSGEFHESPAEGTA